MFNFDLIIGLRVSVRVRWGGIRNSFRSQLRVKLHAAPGRATSGHQHRQRPVLPHPDSEQGWDKFCLSKAREATLSSVP